MTTTRKKQKILYVVTKGNWGGAQRYVFDLATHLPKEKFDIAAVIGENGLLSEKLTGCGVRTIPIPALQRDISLLKEVSSFFALLQLFRKERPDIIHLNSSKAAFLGAVAARLYQLVTFNSKPKTIFTVHGWPFTEPRRWPWRVAVWLASYVTALLSSRVIVITASDVRQAHAMPGVRAKTRLISNGIAMPAFLSREEARTALHLPRGGLVVGSIGELTRNKDYPELITVAARLMGERYDFALVVIGEGEDRAEITKRIKGAPVLDGRRILLGFKENAYRYLKAFDVFVLNSRKEGLPYALLEAGAAGLPVATTSVGGIPDVIENEKTGLLAPPYMMADALRTLLADRELREELGSALRRRIERVFSFDKMRRQTLRLYGQTTGAPTDEYHPDGKEH